MNLSFKRSSKKAISSLEEAQKEIERLEEQIKTLSDVFDDLQEQLLETVSKVGITRFNPFGESGGDQSFTIGLLNAKKNGVIITSHYGRDANRVYAKPVTEGKSEYLLSDEEQALLNQISGEQQKKEE